MSKNTGQQHPIGVIGGGIAGCTTALALAEKGYQVILYEIKNDVLQGSSNITPGRIAVGFHYADVNTAIRCLNNSIEFVKYYQQICPNLRIAETEASDYYLKRGRYFITNNSLFSQQQAEKAWLAVVREYQKLCQSDSRNQVFGDPKQLLVKLSKSDYSHLVNVVCGYETAESLLNWSELKKSLLYQINNYKNITVKRKTDVRSIEFNSAVNNHVLTLQNNGTIYTNKVCFVINCAWQNSQLIESNSNFIDSLASELITSRLKLVVKIKLPESLRETNSMFFCFGAHCMLSNIGNGEAFVTYANVSNIYHHDKRTEQKVIELLNKLDHLSTIENLNSDQIAEKNSASHTLKTIKEAKGKAIIESIAQHYIPDMKNATYLDAAFGFVLTRGRVNIDNPASDHHQRDYSGISCNLSSAYIRNLSTKLIFAHQNTIKVSQILDDYLGKDNN